MSALEGALAWIEDLFDPSVAVGLIGPFAIVVGALALGWAIHKTREVTAWRQAEEAAQTGWEVCKGRLDEANKWGAELDKRRLAVEVRYAEQEKLTEALTERLRVQDERVAVLLERTPEALWQAVEQHSAEAAKHWAFERATLERLESIGEGVTKLLEEKGK